MSKTIEKKILPQYFEQILSCQKTFELRLADWECHPGDSLNLKEIDPATGVYTGRSLSRKVGYIVKTKDIPYFIDEEVSEYGDQIISLLDEESS